MQQHNKYWLMVFEELGSGFAGSAGLARNAGSDELHW
jgi:hypothetical protein